MMLHFPLCKRRLGTGIFRLCRNRLETFAGYAAPIGDYAETVSAEIVLCPME